MFIAADVYLSAVRSFRSVYYDGRYGGGKTLLATATALNLAKNFGYSIYSNIPVHHDNVVDVPTFCEDDHCPVPRLHAVYLYDEAWGELGAGTKSKQINEYLAYLRKWDIITLLPSVLPLARDAWLVHVERIFCGDALGIPLWVYAWKTRGKSVKNSGGRFAIWRPSKYFGTYDTDITPLDMPPLGAYHYYNNHHRYDDYMRKQRDEQAARFGV
ncbi:MAG TPA: hypothetical protein VLL52_17835 [Anaerolineae bacterium]|nr:hypothetical protein [Anaerolineae bacterium]